MLCFLGIWEVFEKVSHERLRISRASTLWNQWKFVELDLIHERSLPVVINGINSKPSFVLTAVPQGVVLAPLLFLIFIVQDLHCTVRLHTNDILICITISTPKDVSFHNLT